MSHRIDRRHYADIYGPTTGDRVRLGDTNLVAEGLGQHIPKGYTYFAMFFSFLVEMLNLRLRAKQAAVRLHDTPTSGSTMEA